MANGEKFCNSTYGGMLYQKDFRISYEDEYYDDFHSMSSIAERIEKDIKFDKKCKRLSEERDNKTKEKELKINNGKDYFTLNIKTMKIFQKISLHNGYSVIAIKTWKCNRAKYSVEFQLRKENINRWEYALECENIGHSALQKKELCEFLEQEKLKNNSKQEVLIY